MTGVTWSLSAATLACAPCTGSFAVFAAGAAFAPYAGIALGFAEALIDVLIEPFVDVFVSGVGNGVMRALFANGDCDAVAALWFSDASGVDEAADEPSPGPHASSMMVASTTIAAVDRVVDARLGRRILMCASVRWGWVAHSFAVDEERIVKRAKTFAGDEFPMQTYCAKIIRRRWAANEMLSLCGGVFVSGTQHVGRAMRHLDLIDQEHFAARVLRAKRQDRLIGA
ncbi:MAG TPA: hypothetical protein VJS18_09960 [Paraburkholderia sp.]|nr:hypothetical protein [Paraburkholderia sp.]